MQKRFFFDGFPSSATACFQFVEQCDQVMFGCSVHDSLACKVELGIVLLARHVY